MAPSRGAPSIEQQLALLTEGSAMLLASPELAAVLQTILDLAKRFIQADAYSVWRKSAKKNAWEMMAMEGLSERYPRTVGENCGEEEAMPTEPVASEDLEHIPFAGRRNDYRAEGICSLLTVPLRIHGALVGLIVFYWRSPRRFSELEVRVSGALGNLAAAALGGAELYEHQKKMRRKAEEQEHKASYLAEAGRILLASLDYEKTLAAVVNLAVPSFADWACADILDSAGEVKRMASKHLDPEKIRLNEELRRRFPQLETDIPRIALRTGRPVLIEQISDELIALYGRCPEHMEMFRKLGIESVILAPLVANERCFGMLMFITAESGRHYTESDFALALELARRAATAVENARLYSESQKARQDLVRANSNLRRANEDLHQFAYSVSHDLREPLRMLSIYSQMLERNCGSRLDDDSKEFLGYITEGAGRMDALLADLLAYLRVADALPAESVLIDAAAILDKSKANLSGMINDSSAEIRAELLPRVRVEEIHMLQLFQNLIGNAIKYRGERPPMIRISCKREGAWRQICVQDNGIGIAPEYREQVFGIFKRLHNRAEYPGTGIGLAICQKIVDRYGGRIWVESEPGEGSTFCFTLPGES
ncbi:MAG: ATP-binding protein [Bryobacteraceae bacterium]